MFTRLKITKNMIKNVAKEIIETIPILLLSAFLLMAIGL